jgi:hypothetical protein
MGSATPMTLSDTSSTVTLQSQHKTGSELCD